MAFNETLRSMQLNYLIATTPDNVRRQLTQHYCRLAGIDLFSLASRSDNTIDMTTARDFIDWLVELCVENGIPCMDTLLNRCEISEDTCMPVLRTAAAPSAEKRRKSTNGIMWEPEGTAEKSIIWDNGSAPVQGTPQRSPRQGAADL